MNFFKKTKKREQFKKFVSKDHSFLKKIVGGEDEHTIINDQDKQVKI